MQTDALLERWALARPHLEICGSLKASPEDFVVFEQAQHADSQAQDPENLEDGQPAVGEHLYLYLQKRGQTTRELVRSVADANRVPISSIGYAGMKDKHAVTRQWVSVPIGPEGTNIADVQVPDNALELGRLVQAKKLRRGWHQGNSFDILLRGLRGADASLLETRLQQIAEHGVPNYFGEQRFGEDNLARAIAWLPRRRKESNAFRKGLYLSVLRSFLFNEVLSARIKNDSWLSCLDGETNPEGPLWGRGRVPASDAVVDFERDALSEHMDIAGELEFAGLSQQRRALRLTPEEFSWDIQTASASSTSASTTSASALTVESLRLQFFLGPGFYATSVLRELGTFSSRVAGGAE